MGEPVNFAVAVETVDDRVIVHVEGDLDMASVDAFEEALAAAPESSSLVLDLGACTFLDSSGMRAIVAAVGRSGDVTIVATDPGVLRGLEITALDTIVSVHSSLDEAS